MRRHESAAVFLTNLYLWGIMKITKAKGGFMKKILRKILKIFAIISSIIFFAEIVFAVALAFGNSWALDIADTLIAVFMLF